jgi:polyisoprenoid-binding protein YceI
MKNINLRWGDGNLKHLGSRLSLSAVATRLVFFFLLVSILFPSLSRAQDPPVFEITPVDSTMKFDVKASVAIAGKFDKWDATLTFTSPELSTAVLDIKIQAASVDTGSGMKKSRLRLLEIRGGPSR